VASRGIAEKPGLGDSDGSRGRGRIASADRRLIEAFESSSLPDGGFRHRDHVRVAWIYLRALPPAAALDRFAAGLRRFAASKGKPGLYHETITWAYLLLIRERMERGGRQETFDRFAARNPDLLAWKPSILDAYYRKETLASDLARRVFVLPDKPSPEPARGPAPSGPRDRADRSSRSPRDSSPSRPSA